ncbi:hypothetical protein EAE96_010360 [Botrytis aclada]|nr:hypothetical protein EAE96_010360 [Botrytis aclada]
MSAEKKDFRQRASCELHHMNLSFQEDLQPSFDPSRSPHPSQPCPPRRLGPHFAVPNPDGSYTYFRDCSEPEGSSHPETICPPRHIRFGIWKTNQDGFYDYLGA